MQPTGPEAGQTAGIEEMTTIWPLGATSYGFDKGRARGQDKADSDLLPAIEAKDGRNPARR